MEIIQFVNACTVVSDAALASCVAALQTQVSSHFYPVYGLIATLSVAKAISADPMVWPVIVGDNSDQLDALGYHELGPSGQPMGKVFAKSTIEDKGSWTVTTSHELLEMLADPWACICAQGSDGNIRAYEVADAVEDDQFAYTIGNVLVSDFVYPAWFDGSPGPYDFKGHVTKPLEILSNGYIGLYVDGQWTQATDSKVVMPAARQTIFPGSRRNKRMLGPHNWRRSELAA